MQVRAIELKYQLQPSNRKVMKHKQLGEQGDFRNSHCEADNVRTALYAHFTNFHVREKNSTHSRGSTARLVPIPTGIPRTSAPLPR